MFSKLIGVFNAAQYRRLRGIKLLVSCVDMAISAGIMANGWMVRGTHQRLLFSMTSWAGQAGILFKW